MTATAFPVAQTPAQIDLPPVPAVFVLNSSGGIGDRDNAPDIIVKQQRAVFVGPTAGLPATSRPVHDIPAHRHVRTSVAALRGRSRAGWSTRGRAGVVVIHHGTVMVATTPTLVCRPDWRTDEITVVNVGSATVYIGDETLCPGESRSNMQRSPIYAATASGESTLAFRLTDFDD